MAPGVKPAPPGHSKRPENMRRPWEHAEQAGWQHGTRPKAPSGLSSAAKRTWATWFGAWWAFWWSPEDVPVLELAIRAYDDALTDPRARATAISLLDRMGCTAKGRQDLRWAPPKDIEEPEVDPVTDELAQARASRAARVS